jgi:two-component system, LuxR family, sensor kinase FixL
MSMSGVLNRLLDPKHRWPMLISAFGMIAAIAYVDWRVQPYISIGFLYLIPVLLVSIYLGRPQIIVTSLICAVLQEAFAHLPESERVIRLIFGSIGFVATGLFVSELLRNRERILIHAEELRRSMQLRRDAEGQLQLLVDTSPAAIVTIDAHGEVVVANEAALQMLDMGEVQLVGQSIHSYLPTLQGAIENQHSQIFRASLQCRGQRSNGESFLAGIWFSTYTTLSGPRLTAIIADLSDDLVSRGASSLDYTLRNTRILMSGMAHEVRNVCSAMRVIYKNLSGTPEMAGSEDFRALDSLIQSLDKISSEELRSPSSASFSMVRLSEVLDELRVLVDNAYSDSGITVRWSLADSLPLVRADRFGLVQVFLNLTSNSKRAMESTQKKELLVGVMREAQNVVIRFVDTGTGISSPEKLFRPFQPGSGVTGLGLYVSRSIMRSFGGDLIFEPTEEGSCFAVVLPASVESNAHA